MATQRQIVGYGPNGPVYADPAFGGAPPPIDMAFGGSPSAAATPGFYNPSAYTGDPQAVQANLAAGGPGLPTPPATATAVPGVPGGSSVDPTNMGAGGGGNALGLMPNAYGPAMSNPDLLSATYNMNSGVGPNSGVAQLNRQYGNNLNYLYLMTQGNNALGGSGEDYFNWANNYMQQGNTPGGAHISSGQVMNALFSNDPRNPIYANLYSVDQNGKSPTPDLIVNRFLGIMQSGLQNTAPPLVINALTSMYAQAGQEWEVLVSQGKYQGTLTDYLTQKGLDPASLGMQ